MRWKGIAVQDPLSSRRRAGRAWSFPELRQWLARVRNLDARGLHILAAGLIGLTAGLTTASGARAEAAAVDLQLVLAVDVSYSMDEEEQRLQRQGYVEAITSKEVLDAIAQGRQRRIAVAYVEWAGSSDQKLLLDWRVIDGKASADSFAEELLSRPYTRVFRTSISGGLLFAAAQFDPARFASPRRVIDVSGDGANNQGILVTMARDALVAKGITINGLPIVLNRPGRAYMDVPDLDVYYEDCVIGGDDAFVVPIRSRDDFVPATRRKLLQEIASRPEPLPRVIPVATRQSATCDIGERMWRDRNGMGN